MASNHAYGILLDGHLDYEGKPLEVHWDRGRIKTMTQGALNRLLSRSRRGVGRPRDFERLLDHIAVVSHHYGFLRTEAADWRSWGERVADENHRLRDRLTEVFGLLTDEQKAVMRQRDDARRIEHIEVKNQ